MVYIDAWFKDKCDKFGFELLRDDIRFINGKLSGITGEPRKSILTNYLKEWYKGMVETENVQSMQQNGRIRANKYMLSLKESK